MDGEPWAAFPALPPPSPSPAPSAPTVRQEWTVDRVRNVLLWVGAALLALSALTFTAVAWSHLGDGGRATLLAGTTVQYHAIALRRRLPASGGLRRALDRDGVRRLVGAAPGRRHNGVVGFRVVAVGSLVVSALAFGFGRRGGAPVGEVAIVVARSGRAELAVGTIAGAAWSFGLGFVVAARSSVPRRASTGDSEPRGLCSCST